MPGRLRLSVYEGEETVAQWIEHGPMHQEVAGTSVIKGPDVRQTLMGSSTERKPACPQREETGEAGRKPLHPTLGCGDFILSEQKNTKEENEMI